MKNQAEKFGARIDMDVVLSVDFSHGSPFTIKTGNSEYRADTVIVTSGASPRLLEVPGEVELTGRGVSYCGTCDGYFFRNKKVVVVGGGDSAIKEGLFLTKFATTVDVIHRRDSLRAESALQERARANDKVSFIWNTVVEQVNGANKVESVRLRNIITGETQDYPTDGVFIFVGHDPNNSVFEGQLKMDEHGFVITDKMMCTSVEGVFAAGVIRKHLWGKVGTFSRRGRAGAMAGRK